ncbi:hypothetical protein DUI87_14777 [Hirundo rustica rustica]|uniref:Ribosome production factor 1 n=1 Tax=Hirundo rustica rustica TaxID=333673 RepID=A0A3M0K7G1_HIRRU|nr:hypothetical protein DUI87_14777 [Hirundo rustica rustica]
MAGEGTGPVPGDGSGPPAPERVLFPPTFSVSEIKNKQRRHFMFLRWKQQQRKEKLALKKKRRKEREALGDKAPPKAVPKTIENQRVYDETTVDPNDEEVAFDEATDEFAPYFNRQTVPKILITTSDRPRGRTVRFCEQLATVIPNSHVYYRRGLALKRIIPQCIARDFTDLIVINEDRKIPNGLVLSHLPDGPTAHFRMSSVRLRKEIKRKGKEPTEHVPEVILNNFTTRLGHSIGRMFAALFPHDPQFIGRQVATFHNQRDYIFFRFHRYIFKSEKKVGIQELGPRFTLKLRSLQKGTFDSKFGEYEWIHKLVELHVFYVPAEVWNFKLNTVPVALTSKFVSAGFISLQQNRTEKTRVGLGEKLDNQADENKQNNLTCPKECISPPSPPFLALTVNPAQVPVIQAAKNKMVEQLQQMKKDRKHMEKAREELIKKAKGLLEQNKLRRYQVREEWKKKYFEMKKATVSLEDTSNKLRQGLELYHQKLLLQLEARDSQKRRNNTTSKNYTIIRIATVQHELDQLRRKLDDTKMRLLTEIKMRKQAASDLRALRAELTQKKL